MMRNVIILSFIFSGLFLVKSVQAQGRRIDTTATYSDAGFHVTCSNKKENQNAVTVSPKGFKNTAREFTLEINGRLNGILVDDLNDDGFPDLLLLIYSGANHEIGTVYGVSSVDNSSLVPVSFPDIYNDPKLRDGYKGHDVFTVTGGSLLRSYPIYKAGDSNTPTGVTMVVQYKIVPSANQNGALTFKLLRTYEKQQ